MGDEFRHLTVGGVISQAEYEAIGGHIFDSQATGDILYASSPTQLSRLTAGANGEVLTLAAGIPSWAAAGAPGAHEIDSSGPHTAAGLTIGHVLRATGATAFSFGTIADAAISATAEIAVSKLADGTARQLLQTNAAGTGVEWTSDIVIPNTLYVDGPTTLVGAITVGGGYGATGVTISVEGVIQANGAITTDGTLTALNVVASSPTGGGFSAQIPAASVASTGLSLIQGTGTGAADNMRYSLDYAPSVSYLRLRSEDIDGGATGGNIFKVLDGTDDVKFYGDITPNGDGDGSCGTAALTWGDVHTVLFNGADINLDNDWTMLEAEDFPGYPGGWALTHRQSWRKAEALSKVAPGTGTRLFPKGAKPVFAVTDDFIEYKGRRLTPEILDRILSLVAA